MSLIRSSREKCVLMNISGMVSIINIPSTQRVVQSERVDEIYKSIEASYLKGLEFLAPNALIVAQIKETSHLIDGQHRFLAYLKLLNTHGYDTQVFVITVVMNTDEELTNVFNLINNTLPANKIPEGICRSSCNDVLKYFQSKYPNNFSSSRSTSTVRPHIHITKFEEQIMKLIVVYPSNLIEKLEELNEELKMCNILQFKKSSSDKLEKLTEHRAKAIQKGGLLFGMFPNFSCFDKLYPKTSATVFQRRSVPTALRAKVWNMYNRDSLEGKCPWCPSTITKENCHMAHDVAHAKGGDISVDNLYPCCSSCNLSMGTHTFEEFEKLKFRRQLS